MQNTLFISAVTGEKKLRPDVIAIVQNEITVVDEHIPAPGEIQSDETIVLPEIISMTEYIRRHCEREIVAACINQIYMLRLCVMYEGKLFHDVPGLGPIDYGEEELVLTDGPTPSEWGEPRAHSYDPNVYVADVRPVNGSITWMSFRRIADGCIEADLTIEMEINFRYGSYGRFKRITQKYYTTAWFDFNDDGRLHAEHGEFTIRRPSRNKSGIQLDEYLVPVFKWEDIEEESETIIFNTHLLYREDLDQLEIWYLGRLNSTRSLGGSLYCFRKTSRNGVHWSRYEIMYCFDEIGLASPSVIYLEGRYHFWGIRHDSANIGLYYMTSENGKEWSALEKCNVPMARETDMWHGSVSFWKDRYYVVWVGWAGKSRNEIYLADSMDGKNWEGTRRILYNDAGWAYLYRPALLMGEKSVYLYYGVVRHDGKWMIALSSGEDVDHLCGICPAETENHVEYVSFTRRMMLKKSINQIKALIVPRILVQIPLLFVLQCLSKSVWVVWGISMILSVAAHYFLFYRGKCLTGGIVMGTLCAASTTFVYQVMSEAIAWIKWLA